MRKPRLEREPRASDDRPTLLNCPTRTYVPVRSSAGGPRWSVWTGRIVRQIYRRGAENLVRPGRTHHTR